ncbi:MAG: hypothetical protein ACRDYE_16365, partial [Acidimicrobiales bacterium]
MHSLREILSRWVVVFLSVVALVMVGLAEGTAFASAPAGGATAGKSQSSGPTGGSGNGAATSADGDVNPATWMHDVAPQIHDRQLSHIVIPGSHDTGTYGLTNPGDEYARTQDEDITHQLSDGIRQFDIRAVYRDGDFFARHQAYVSGWLRLSQEFAQISAWTKQPGHDQEIILLSVSIDQTRGDPNVDPSPVCTPFRNDLGSALLTPNELKAAYGITDPSQVTLDQLWAMPGHPRVIMDNPHCLGADAGQWIAGVDDHGNPNPYPFDGYYANQCYADPYGGGWWGGEPGIWQMVSQAADTRVSSGGPYFPADIDDVYGPNAFGPPLNAGFYEIGVAATTTLDCGFPLISFDLDAQNKVVSRLYNQWWTDRETQRNLNIVSGDFVEPTRTDLIKDSIAMDQSLPVFSDSITPLGAHKVVVSQGQQFP